MLKQVILTLMAATAVFSAPAPSGYQPLDFQILTSNVRNDAKPEKRFPHELAWSIRKERQISTIKEHSSKAPTLVGIQEAVKNQLDDIVLGLNDNQTIQDGWTSFGVGRDDGVEKGEYAAVLYNQSEWELVNGTYKWLSPTPDVPSKAWGAGNIRIVTITELKHKETGRHVNFLNTHYDDKSQEAREQSSYLILDFIAAIPNDYETYLAGDFNSVSTDLSYTTLVKGLTDTREVAYTKFAQGPTYSGFEPGDNQTVIDFVWTSPDANQPGGKTLVRTYDVIDNLVVGEPGLPTYRFSDHRPVVVGLTTF